jgi:50S ribosome-binding GTPase
VTHPAPDPARLLAQAEIWVAALRKRGLVAQAMAARLDGVLVQSHGERLDIADDPLLVVMLCGPTAVGKSSLINAIAGAEISRPGLGAETPAAVVYVHERDELARLFEYGEALGQLGRESSGLVRHSRDALLHIVLIDTPDIDSVLQRHREITAALVHCADLVLFVTSPEKYKTMQSARWVAQQRQQRAIAFVLNKWDRPALGPQYHQRQRVAADFLALLASEGFPDPIVFKLSALPAGSEVDPEHGLFELRTWLEQGLSQSSASAIRDRRQRAAWGRVGAAIAPALPVPLTDHAFIAASTTRFEEARAQAHRLVRAEAASLASSGLSRSIRPNTPGLLGSWLGLSRRLGAAVSTVRELLAWPRLAARIPLSANIAGSEELPVMSNAFGQPSSRLLAKLTTLLARDADAKRFPLGPAREEWAITARGLGADLAVLPSAVAAELTARSLRPSVRRVMGTAALFAIEALLTLVLGTTLWRIGSGFVRGDYVSAPLLLNALALIVVLLLIGQMAANIFFPPLQERLRRVVSQRADASVDIAWQRVRDAVAEQVAIAATLAQDGRDLLTGIGEITQTRAAYGGAAETDVRRLFGDGAPDANQRGLIDHASADDAARRFRLRSPKFD